MKKTVQSRLTLDGSLGFLQTLWALDHGLHSQSKRMARQKGITGPQRIVLRVVDMRPGVSPSELASVLFFDRGTISGIVRRLERGGFVRRVADPGDRRRSLLTLTPRGRRLAREASGSVEERVRLALGKQPAHRIEAAKTVLSAVAKALARR